MVLFLAFLVFWLGIFLIFMYQCLLISISFYLYLSQYLSISISFYLFLFPSLSIPFFIPFHFHSYLFLSPSLTPSLTPSLSSSQLPSRFPFSPPSSSSILIPHLHLPPTPHYPFPLNSMKKANMFAHKSIDTIGMRTKSTCCTSSLHTIES